MDLESWVTDRQAVALEAHIAIKMIANHYRTHPDRLQEVLSDAMITKYIIACRQNQENTSVVANETDRRNDMTPNGDSNGIGVNKMFPIRRIRRKTEIAVIKVARILVNNQGR
jgi:hypothetical protein